VMWLCGKEKVSAPCAVTAVYKKRRARGPRKRRLVGRAAHRPRREVAAEQTRRGTEAVFHTASTARYASKRLCSSMRTT